MWKEIRSSKIVVALIITLALFASSCLQAENVSTDGVTESRVITYMYTK